MGHGNCYPGQTYQEKTLKEKTNEIIRLKRDKAELEVRLARKQHRKLPRSE
jgi:hypothetical protein